MSLLFIPFILVSIFLAVIIPKSIREHRNEKAWNTYNKAWYEWYNNGRKGEMPQAEDYGYKDYV